MTIEEFMWLEMMHAVARELGYEEPYLAEREKELRRRIEAGPPPMKMSYTVSGASADDDRSDR